MGLKFNALRCQGSTFSDAGTEQARDCLPPPPPLWASLQDHRVWLWDRLTFPPALWGLMCEAMGCQLVQSGSCPLSP